MLTKIETALITICAVCVSLVVSLNAVPGQENVVLSCAISKPVWEKDNKTIETSGKGYVIDKENGTLIIEKIDKDHLGNYVCRTEDKTTSHTITVFVGPHVNSFEKTKNMIEDDPLQLECKGYGYPDPVVQWSKGTELKATDGDRITLKDTAAAGETGLMINGTIRITKMTFDDAGDYHCEAMNEHGVANATIKVQVKDKLAALWPFLGICAEVAILCTIIFIYEKRRAKKMQMEEERAAVAEEAERLNANNETKGADDVRQRK